MKYTLDSAAPEIEVFSMKEEGIKTDVEENGTTFEENAVLKAKAVTELTDAVVLADDLAWKLTVWAESRASIQHAIWEKILRIGLECQNTGKNAECSGRRTDGTIRVRDSGGASGWQNDYGAGCYGGHHRV